MPSFRLKRIALEDLKGILRFIAADNPTAARRFRDDLYERFGRLAENPRSAPERADIAPGLRYLPYGNYLIFYLPDEDGITVIRVLHGARLLTPELIAAGLRE